MAHWETKKCNASILLKARLPFLSVHSLAFSFPYLMNLLSQSLTQMHLVLFLLRLIC